MTNKKIWILRTGEPIFSDGSDIRPQRAINLARKMSSLGFDVKLISPIFYHQKKTHRSIKSLKGNYFEGIEEILLWSPGYKNHISLGRFIDHSILSINLFFYFLSVNPKYRPDIIYVGYPPVDWAFVSVIAAKLFNIKSIVEVEDLWPDLFKQRVKGRFSKLLISIISLPYVFYARVIVLLSDKISSPTIEMADFFIKKYGKKRNYLEYKKKIFETPLIPPKLIEKDADFSDLDSLKVFKNLDNLKIFFAGSLMSVYDFKTVSEALRLLNKECINYTLLVLGSGSYENEIKSFFKGNQNVKFLGWISYDDMKEVAKTCHISLSPYKSIPNYNLNIPNKILDYISMGLPIVTPVSGCTKSLIKKHNIGWSYEPENKKSLAKVLKEVISNHQVIRTKARNCIDLYRIKYDFKLAYSKIATQITDLL